MSEYSEHKAVCDYIKLQYPKVIFTSDLSGVRLTQGLAKKCKPLKSSRGIPDIIIFEARGGYHGLLIEMKRTGQTIYLKGTTILKKDKHLAEQAALHRRLIKEGYYCDFAVGFDEGKSIIDFYMGLNLTK